MGFLWEIDIKTSIYTFLPAINLHVIGDLYARFPLYGGKTIL